MAQRYVAMLSMPASSATAKAELAAPGLGGCSQRRHPKGLQSGSTWSRARERGRHELAGLGAWQGAYKLTRSRVSGSGVMIGHYERDSEIKFGDAYVGG